MPINMPVNRKEGTLDKILKGLQVAQGVFSIPIEWEKLKDLQAQRDAREAEQKRNTGNVLTPKELLSHGKDYDTSQTQGPGSLAFNVMDPAAEGGQKPVYLTPKKKEGGLLEELIKGQTYAKNQREMNSPKAEFDNLPVESQAQIKSLADANAKKTSIRNQLAATLQTLRDEKVPYEQKIMAARNSGKTLNSTEGQDAVGEGEAKRMLSFLNNVPWGRPGWDFGPQLEKFADQVAIKVDDIGQAISSNGSEIDRLYGRSGQAQAQAPVKTDKNWEKKPGGSPLMRSAHAGQKPPAGEPPPGLSFEQFKAWKRENGKKPKNP